MATKAKRHIHKYYKADLDFGEVWACALPDCSHYMPKHMAKLVNGKSSICWKCNEKMILDPNNMNIDKPVCYSCAIGVTEEIPLTESIRAFLSKE